MLTIRLAKADWAKTWRAMIEVAPVRLVRDDALHVAVTAVNGIQFLLTWNCKHIANASFRPGIERVCREAGYEAPVICTPEELMGINDDIF